MPSDRRKKKGETREPANRPSGLPPNLARAIAASPKNANSEQLMLDLIEGLGRYTPAGAGHRQRVPSRTGPWPDVAANLANVPRSRCGRDQRRRRSGREAIGLDRRRAREDRAGVREPGAKWRDHLTYTPRLRSSRHCLHPRGVREGGTVSVASLRFPRRRSADGTSRGALRGVGAGTKPTHAGAQHIWRADALRADGPYKRPRPESLASGQSGSPSRLSSDRSNQPSALSLSRPG
jgi:hypothetical protein